MPEFDEALATWKAERTLPAAAELVSAAVVLGRITEVTDAARFLADSNSDTTATLREIAKRALEGKTGYPVENSEIGFLPDAHKIHAAIGAFKQSLRRYPRNPVAWVDLARLYTIIGQLKPARHAIGIAAAEAPNNRFVIRSTARFFAHLNAPESLDEGLQILRVTPALKYDPWVMAAEISLSMIAGVTPKSIARARKLSADDSFDPWDSSELNGALGTFALINDGLGKPSKLFNKSLRSPTENAVAQAEWAANKYPAILVPEHLLQKPGVHEALALHYRERRQWNLVLDACRNWSALEPTSTRPLMAGSFIALTALQDGKKALEFIDRAALTRPNDPIVLNDRTVALAYLGRLDEARIEYAKIKPLGVLPIVETAYLATGGMLLYREGRRSEGFELYMQAMKSTACRTRHDFRALVVWHLLREESEYGIPDTLETAKQVWEHTKALRIPEIASMYELIQKIGTPNASGRYAISVASTIKSALLDTLPEKRKLS